MPHDHSHDFDGASAAYRRALIAVIVLNGALFFVEMTAGALAGSRALQADALDFGADALTYALSLAVIGRALTTRAWVARLKGVSLALMGLWVLGSALYDMLAPGVPRAEVMGAVGLAALAANVASVLILMRWRDGDSNVRSVWLCSRNDAIGNIAVMGAAVAVAALNSGWPDLVVAVGMAGLFLSSSVQILRRAGHEIAHGH
ncbi:cation transporter [Pararhodobacter zhoushanensis]|uniref:Cation transporter n=1 Tax=Pararhodobacter zhoushanensis TaxID=2479545 RepID=A0ABT3GZQ7_9RHOB|nr:cation transporter [Pararhodobacter zhoushanensis]MCW1932955.1 cation transporter [Pararhodobacter zhoushanensis]